jgi:hypothetical protein
VERAHPQIDPYANDPGRWAHSMQNLAEIVLPCLDAAGVRSVVEVGAYAGDLTELLVEWAAGGGARVIAIDPSPQDRLVALAEEHERLELVRETSLAALPRLAPADAVIVDRGAAADRGRRRRRPAPAPVPRRVLAARPA